MTDSVHKWGALAGVELCHAGGLANALSTRYVSPAAHQFATPWIPQALYLRGGRLRFPAASSSMYRRGGQPSHRCRLRHPLHPRHPRRPAGADAVATSQPAHRPLGRFLREPGAVLGRSPRSRSRSGGRPMRRRQPVFDRPAFRAGRRRGRARRACASSSMSTGLGLVDLWDVNIIAACRNGARTPRPRASRSRTTRRRGRGEVKQHRQGSGGRRRPLHRSRRDGARGPHRPVRHHRLRAALDRRSVAAAQDRRGPRRRHRRMHRLQPVHRPLRIRRADRLHAEPDRAGGIPPRLASRKNSRRAAATN